VTGRLAIRSQVLLAITGISLVSIAALAYLVIGRVEARAVVLAHQSAQENANLFALLASRGMEKTGASFEHVTKRLNKVRTLMSLGDDQATRVQIFDSDGKLRFDTDKAQRYRDADPAVAAVLADQPNSEPVVLEARLVAAAAPVRSEPFSGPVVGAVRVIKPALGAREILSSIAPEVITLALGCAVLAILWALVVGRSISRPITRLTEAARRVAGGDRGYLLPTPRGREVAALTEAFDGMRRELQDKHRIERLTQDLSHELKNPIAAVRALAETLRDGALEEPKAAHHLVGQIQNAAERLDAIVGDVLDLSRLEARGVSREQRIAIETLVGEALQEVALLAESHAVQLQSLVAGTGQKLPTLRGDRIWLGRALVNLLTNAIENSQEGQRVEITCERIADRLALRVANPGEVPEALRNSLFERFVTRRPKGTGLGLAIARSVAEAHGGGLRLQHPGPPMVVLELQLPID